MEITSTIGTDGRGSGLDFPSFDTSAFDIGALNSETLDLGFDGAALGVLRSSDDVGDTFGFGVKGLESLVGVAGEMSDPVAQGNALRTLDGATGSRDATDGLVAKESVSVSSAADAAGQRADIVVTADQRLSELVSPEHMNDTAFAQFERDDAGLRMERDVHLARTGEDYSILPAERELAMQYNLMGNFVGLTSLAPSNYYPGDRPAPGSLEDIGGKIWASPMTAVGVVAGTANVVAGALSGNENAAIRIDDNAIQFVGGAFGQGSNAIGYGGDGAVTIGNTQLYAGSVTPDSPTRGYDNGPSIRTGDHEEGHTYQYQDRGVGFLPDYLSNGLQNGANPFEQAADAGARGGNPIP